MFSDVEIIKTNKGVMFQITYHNALLYGLISEKYCSKPILVNWSFCNGDLWTDYFSIKTKKNEKTISNSIPSIIEIIEWNKKIVLNYKYEILCLCWYVSPFYWIQNVFLFNK